MNPWFAGLMLVCLMASGSTLQAQEPLLRVLVVDPDPQGTNVRDAPSGKIVHVIPAGKSSLRLVSIRKGNGRWFRVEAPGVSGWMHSSVLGLCAAPTEDGDPGLCSAPDNRSPCSMRIPAYAPVMPLQFDGHWLKVRYRDPRGVSHEGWLPEQVIRLGESELEACAATWAARR